MIGNVVRLVQMYRMSVWDALGRQYLPVYGYDGQITNYAPAREALKYWEQNGIDQANKLNIRDLL